MVMPVPLSRLSPGQQAVICSLRSENDMRRRLEDIGFTPTSVVSCLYRSALGDPTAYGIRGSVIALRAEDAGNILVLPEDGEAKHET